MGRERTKQKRRGEWKREMGREMSPPPMEISGYANGLN